MSNITKFKKLILELEGFNSDTIQHVTACIFDICGHNLLQSEQCTHLIHHTGKCNVFEGTYELCSQIYEELTKEGLTVKLLK